MEHTAAEWEIILITAWRYLTPVALCLAAAVMLLRLVISKKYRVRMARASAFLILSYAVFMLRVITHQFNPGDGNGGGPLPFYAAFYLVAAVYFMYALIVDWVVPFLFWGYLKMRGIQYETATQVAERINRDA